MDGWAAAGQAGKASQYRRRLAQALLDLGRKNEARKLWEEVAKASKQVAGLLCWFSRRNQKCKHSVVWVKDLLSANYHRSTIQAWLHAVLCQTVALLVMSLERPQFGSRSKEYLSKATQSSQKHGNHSCVFCRIESPLFPCPVSTDQNVAPTFKVSS